MMARQKGAKKRSLHIVNEHFEPLLNAASAALGINQSFLKLVAAENSAQSVPEGVLARIQATAADSLRKRQEPGK